MTIIPRKGKFGVKVWDRGKGAYRWVGTFETEALALLAEEDAGVVGNGDVPTVEQWSRVWLSDYARPEEATRATYRYAAKQIVERFAKLKLNEISRPEARRVAKHEWPRNTSRVARTMWADAVRDGVCELNPWTNLRLETPKGRKDIEALTAEEILILADIALRVHSEYGLEAKAIILTLGLTALRPAEVCALRKTDIDPADLEITAAGSRQANGKVKKPKNGLGRRVVLPQDAIDAIREMPQTIGDEWLFHSKRGKPLSKGTLHYMWREIRAAWLAEGRRYITPYALRHACATALIEEGHAVGDVAFQLGHKDGGRLVMELYGHPAEDAIRDRLKMRQRTPGVRRRMSA